MRPVNLIPPEERRGVAAPTRTGPIAYVMVGALVALFAGVTALVFTNNKISDREAKVTELKQQEADARTRAESLAGFASFHTVQEQRTATVRSLADSRFDWERVMRELALVIPDDVWLTGLTGTVATGVSVGESVSVSQRETITGPALELTGCARGQEGVAEFLAALQDIDGVTRVGLASSELPGSDSSSTSSSTSGGTDSDCRTREFISNFKIVAAFDAVPAPAVPGAAPTEPAPTDSAEPTTVSDNSASDSSSSSDSSGVSQAEQQNAASQQDVKKSTANAKDAVHDYVPGS
jgi:Tfp pilus assembly protein PilN